jgi:mRNA interferase RelE/StbE
MWRKNLGWKISWDERALKELSKLDKATQRKIFKYLTERIAKCEDPKAFGKGLLYEKFGLWRYRVEDYRIVCRILDQQLEVLVVRVGHRKDVYDE